MVCTITALSLHKGLSISAGWETIWPDNTSEALGWGSKLASAIFQEVRATVHITKMVKSYHFTAISSNVYRSKDAPRYLLGRESLPEISLNCDLTEQIDFNRWP